MRMTTCLWAFGIALVAGCGDRAADPDASTLTITSPAFAEGRPIPKKHAFKPEGDNLSPVLAWSGAPAGTMEFALIMDDPDAPSPRAPAEKPWVHWVVYKIPATATGLPEGGAAGALEGRNSWPDRTGYGGPLPPPGSGVHRYFLKLYALGAPVELPAGAAKQELLDAMKGHILARGQLVGTYERKKK